MENPPFSITADEVGHSSEEVAINTSSTSTISDAVEIDHAEQQHKHRHGG